MKTSLIFDLDGTLLDTLTDIRAALNEALAQSGFPWRFSQKECRSLIGNGADALIHRALKESDAPDAFARLKAAYLPLYAAYQERHTKPFNGLKPTLSYLKARGASLYVCTNKPDELARRIAEAKFGEGFFIEVRGLREGDKPKPDPSLAEDLIARHGLRKEDCLFIGDSLPDLLTAQNARLPFCLCEWGYGSYKPDFLRECDFVIKKPRELAKVVLS